jgi:TonB family protein
MTELRHSIALIIAVSLLLCAGRCQAQNVHPEWKIDPEKAKKLKAQQNEIWRKEHEKTAIEQLPYFYQDEQNRARNRYDYLQEERFAKLAVRACEEIYGSSSVKTALFYYYLTQVYSGHDNGDERLEAVAEPYYKRSLYIFNGLDDASEREEMVSTARMYKDFLEKTRRSAEMKQIENMEKNFTDKFNLAPSWGSAEVSLEENPLTAQYLENQAARDHQEKGEQKDDNYDPCSGCGGRGSRSDNQALFAYAKEVEAKVKSHFNLPVNSEHYPVVTFHVDAQGELSLLGLARASGSIATDEAALKAVAAASPFSAPPAVLWRDMRIELPFTFNEPQVFVFENM